MSAPSPSKQNEKIQKLFDLEDDHDRKTVEKSALLQLLKRLWDERSLILWGNLLILATTAAAVYEPRLLGRMIDEAISPKREDLLKTYVAFFFAIQIVRILTLIAHTYLFNVLAQKVMQTLRMELFTKLQTLPLSTFSRVPAGKLVTRLTNDVSSLADMFTAGFVTIVGNILFTIGIMIWLLILSPKLGLITLAVVPPLTYLSVQFSKRLKVAYRTARARLSALNAFLAENILGMKVIFLHNRQENHMNKFQELNQQYATAQFGSVRVFSLFQPTITVATGIAMALLIWFGGDLASQKVITLGFLASYFAYVMSLFQPVREIADKWNIFLAGMASVERIFAILDWDSEEEIGSVETEASGFRTLKGHFIFKDVWFAYEGENWILKGFNFEILPGQKIGVVGPTGSGKTTLINLLLRFYEPQKGEILLDGRPLNSYDKRALRASVGFIQQDVFLFSGSLAENMSLWRPFDDSCNQELRRLTPYHAIEERGLHAPAALEERGGNLSMGERQVLAFGRALYTQPRVWILDEATSNMDSVSERELEECLAHSAQSCTVITIAHRLATVKSADQILVLQHGQILEKGSHQELMNQNGLYARLYEYQEIMA